jgi:hypothetical protein
MSQSDYIAFKKATNELQIQSDLSPVLGSNEYTRFKQFSIETSISNSSPRYNQQPITDLSVNVFDMEKLNTNGVCAEFIMCNGTNERPNRVALSTIYFTPVYVPIYVKNVSVSKCASCSYNDITKTNMNTWLSACSNRRKKDLLLCG